MPRCLLPAPSDLQSLIWYFHAETAGGGEVAIPAMPFPTLGIYIHGAGEYWTEQGWRPVPQAFYIGPFSRPVRMRATTGCDFVCARLWPGQQTRLFDLPDDLLRDVFVPLAFLCRDAANLPARLGAGAGPQDWVGRLLGWLRGLAYQRECRQPDSLLLPSPQLLAPASRLAAQCSLSMRQFERRFRASYGLNLREMHRQLRYLRTMNVLMNQPLQRGDLAGLAAAAGYYDQAQMTRDFSELIGLTPARLLKQQDMDDPDWQLFRFQGQERELVFGSARQHGLFEPAA